MKPRAKPLRLFVDQYGASVYARTVRELRGLVGGGKVSRMFVDRSDGSVAHVGYVVGSRWFRIFEACEKVL